MRYSTIATRFGAVAAAVATTVAVGGASSAQASGPGPTGVVTAVGGLNARNAPTTQATKTGAYHRGVTVVLYCRTTGTSVGGSRVWYSTSPSGTRWVAGGYIDVEGVVPKCPVLATDDAKALATAGLNLRSGPSTSDQVAGSLSSGRSAWARCKVRSQSIDGNNLWYYLENDSWASARYLRNVNGGPGANRTPVWCR